MTQRFLFIILLGFVCFGAWADSPAKLIIAQKVDHLDKLAREPMIVQHPDGSLFVTGYSNEDTVPKIWKSKDEGATWERLNVGTQADRAKAGLQQLLQFRMSAKNESALHSGSFSCAD